MYRRLRPLRALNCEADRCLVPPSPGLMQRLLQQYRAMRHEQSLPPGTSFTQFFDDWASPRRGGPAALVAGLDDGRFERPSLPATGTERCVRPLKGVVNTLVLLVDFPDRHHQPSHTREHYERMLFGLRHAFPTGSMREYYRLASNHGRGRGVDVQGQVVGWLRMPQPVSHYAGRASGMGRHYPHNAQGLALDAVHAAMAAGVDFRPFDVFGEQRLTALIIVHAGCGAEETGKRSDLWSHKWTVPGCPEVTPGIRAATYLMVPEDCKVGVVAHEWGHLAARWGDYYDTGRHGVSNGLGHYCLMASGSWGNEGATPVLPNGMLRLGQGWIRPQVVTASRQDLLLKPAAEGGGCILIRHPRTMAPSQYILVEYRRRESQDRYLPDQGIAVYVVDESLHDENQEQALQIQLVQADGRRDLEALTERGNAGDRGDLYPYRTRRVLGRRSKPPLHLTGGRDSGVTIRVKGRAGDPTMAIDVWLA